MAAQNRHLANWSQTALFNAATYSISWLFYACWSCSFFSQMHTFLLRFFARQCLNFVSADEPLRHKTANLTSMTLSSMVQPSYYSQFFYLMLLMFFLQPILSTLIVASTSSLPMNHSHHMPLQCIQVSTFFVKQFILRHLFAKFRTFKMLPQYRW